MPKTKSGKYWVAWANIHAKNSTEIGDLEPEFRGNLKAFTKALEDAVATVTVNSTRRSPQRAYLFHWAWKIYLGKCQPADAVPRAGVDQNLQLHDVGRSYGVEKHTADAPHSSHDDK